VHGYSPLEFRFAPGLEWRSERDKELVALARRYEIRDHEMRAGFDTLDLKEAKALLDELHA